MHNPIVAIALAGVAAFIFGAVYYMGLGKFYQAALDKTPTTGVGGKPPLGPMAVCLVAEWIMAAIMVTSLFRRGRPYRPGRRDFSGAMLGIGFMATSTVVNNAFPGRKVTLSIIDSIHWIVVATIEGAIIGGLV